MPRSDPYDVFADAYDAWQAGFSLPFSEAILPFYEREIIRRGAPAASLADVACGTGTFLRTWERRRPGWRLFGTDGSAGMLRTARRNGTQARLIHARMEETRLPSPVGVVVSVFDSVNHLTRLLDLRRAFRAIAGSILPGGLFIFDLNDERAFGRLFTGSWSVGSPGLFVSITATAAGAIGTSRFTVFSQAAPFQSRSSWRRSDFSIRERNWHADEILTAVSMAGLELLQSRRIRPYPPDEVDSPRTLWVCRRPVDGRRRVSTLRKSGNRTPRRDVSAPRQPQAVLGGRGVSGPSIHPRSPR